ncbi:ArsR/SmtB family transcription factor [Enterococcus alishanensis]
MNSKNTKKYAQIIMEDSKIAMINLLMSGKFHTVNEIAKAAKIKPHTASYHLKNMLSLNIVMMEKHGRFHYYKLIDENFAAFYESVCGITAPEPENYLSKKIASEKMTQARTCYDHLAGKLGVSVTQFLIKKDYLNCSGKSAKLTEKGKIFLENQKIDLIKLSQQKRLFCHICLDWSERDYHISGAVGHAIYQLFLENGWIVKDKNTRAVILTDKGILELKEQWDLEVDIY